MSALLPVPVIIDFVGSLSILIVLAIAFGALRRRLTSGPMTQIVIGLLFGFVAILQMHAPLSPTEGLIVDLRNIPIALAGAFLGWRGLIACFLCAASVRFGIGGVGTNAGILAMALAGFAGIVWAHLHEEMARKRFSALLTLAIAMSCHLVAAMIMPADLANWFFTSAAPSILLLNLICVPIAGYFLDREIQMIANEERILSNSKTDLETGILTGSAFIREVNFKLAASPAGALTGLVVVQLRHKKYFSRTWSDAIRSQVLGALKHRISELNPAIGPIGLTEDHTLVLPFSRFDIADPEDFAMEIKRLIASEAIRLPNGQRASVKVDVDILEPETVSGLQAEVQDLFDQRDHIKSHGRSRCRFIWPYLRRTTTTSRETGQPENLLRPDELLLFQKADILFAAQRDMKPQ